MLKSLFAAAVLFAANSTAQAFARVVDLHARHFMVVWSYQSPDDDVVKAHTFASFYAGADLANRKNDPPTISWLPSTGAVHPFSTEKGRNFSLSQTLTMAKRAGAQVKLWGPYEIRPELYHRALSRIHLLNSGRIAYSMLGTGPSAMNCIEAAGDLTREPLETGMSWGFEATSEVVRHLSPYFKNHGKVAGAAPRYSNLKPQHS